MGNKEFSQVVRKHGKMNEAVKLLMKQKEALKNNSAYEKALKIIQKKALKNPDSRFCTIKPIINQAEIIKLEAEGFEVSVMSDEEDDDHVHGYQISW